MKIRWICNVFAAAALSLPLVSVGSVVAAQTASTTSAQPSDTELRTFARVYAQYQDTVRQYDPQLTNAKDEASRKKLQDEGNAKLKKLLEREHMSAEEYNRIFKQVNSDENLRKRVLAMVNEERKQTKK